jgi:3-deoxy-7-phosphoheptulonate synthase
MSQLENLNIEAPEVLITPEALKARLPVSESVREVVQQAREVVQNILARRDHRLLVVVGPCSIHDVDAAREYAARLRQLAAELEEDLFVVMRAYFEKPRTTVGWKGLINDPHLDDSFCVGEGLEIARQLLLDIAELGLPLSTEALDPITPQYLQDLITWSAIGARTTESQTHREMASGLSSPIGFKNGTDGSLGVAINALQSVSSPHRFLGISPSGQVSVIRTKGNPHAHIVLRGGSAGPNFDAASIAACEEALDGISEFSNIMVDCSHANSSKDHNRQTAVALDIAGQVLAGNQSIVGLMIESNLEAGNQPLGGGKDLRYGVSVTDACIDWAATEGLLRELASSLSATLRGRVQA